MALIERMSILGIRSFSPESSQKIEFFTPVTLILGPNGTGKTTIIECLKYSCTGDLPPGSKTGCSFIHDPRVARESEVKAKVTLQIRDVRGQSMIVSRALVATHRDKAKQGTLKTLDGSIKRQQADGRVISVSSKCNEIDQEMVTSLGVSKAVLENVIFCHQEDSNWPLQEAKSVKQRFDDLFASSRYAKALDAMRKCKQDKDNTVKIYKTELKHLSKSRDEAVKLRCERAELKHGIEKQQKSLDAVQKKLDPVLDCLNLYKQKYAELVQLQSEIKSCETEKKHLDETISNLLANIQNEFEGTNEQLNAAVEDADSELARKQHTLTKLEESCQLNRIKLRESENQRNRLMVEIAQLEMHVKRTLELSTTRDELVRHAVNRFMLNDCEFSQQEGNLTAHQVESVVRTLETRVQDANSEELDLKHSFQLEDAEETKRVNQAINELARIEQSRDDTERTLQETRNEMTSLRKRLDGSRSTSEQLQYQREQLTRAEVRVKELDASTELPNARSELQRLTEDRESSELALHAIDMQIESSQKNAAQFQEFGSLQKERQTKLEALRKIRSRHLEALEQVFVNDTVPQIISEDEFERHSSAPRLRQAFLSRLTAMEQETRDVRKRLAKSEQDRSVLETRVKFTRAQLKESEDQLRKIEEQILSTAGTLDLEQALNRVMQKKKALEEECANEQGSLYLWKKFRDRLSRTDPDCPVCHRQVSSPSEQDELLTELDQRIRCMPDEFARKKQELLDFTTQHETLLELKPTATELERLRSVDIPNLETRLKKELTEIQTAQTRSDEESARLESCQADEALAKSIQGDMAVLERLENELIDINGKLKSLRSAADQQCAEYGQPSLDTLQQQRRDLRAQQATLSAEVAKCQQVIKQLDEEQRHAFNELHRIKDLVHKLEQENQANHRLEEDIRRLDETCSRLESKLSDLQTRELPTVKRMHDQALEEKRRNAAIREQRLNASTEKTSVLRETLRRLKEACDAVRKASTQGSETTLKHTQTQLHNLENNIGQLQHQIERDNETMECSKKELNEHKIRQRELADCVQLRQLRNNLGKLAVRIDQFRNQLLQCNAVGGSDQDLVRETERLSKEEERLQSEKQIVNNHLGQLQAKLQYLERDLKEKYAEADKEYLDMMYQLKTTELACSDLERYYKALDRAIMSYHASKMMDLNKIIRDLWRSTYRGNDIDYIEICSEEEAAAASSGIARSRRTYNYRVVMVKSTGGPSAIGRGSKSTSTNEARLDMRGRCSAGQKVLASLIIRLALAEVFCLHCGVLALDEPTTNLDRENIESLAHALVEIIKNRRQQKNFQLIVITHDEDFVELLGRSDFVENFFLLSRNAQGQSEIRKVPMDDHFH